jgi:hypothetical protein
VIGGHAVVFHGHVRPVADLDLFVDCEPINAKRVLAAVESLGTFDEELTEQRLCQPRQQVRIGGRFNTELLTAIEGVSFAEAYAAQSIASTNDLNIPVLSLPHLLELKRRLGRPKDIQDIAALTPYVRAL